MIDILLKTQSEFKVVNNIRSLLEVTILKLTLVRNDSKDKVTKEIIKEVVKQEEPTPVNNVKEEVVTEPVVIKTPVIEKDVTKEEVVVPQVNVIKEEQIIKPIEEPIRTFCFAKHHISPIS